MIREESLRHKKKPEDHEVAFITLSWTNNVVRFSEARQLVDVLDVFGTIYGSVSSATTAQTRWLKSGENTEKTAGQIGAEADTLVYKIKWSDEPRQRLALTVKDMRTFLQKCIPNMPRSQDIAKILETTPLTVAAAQDRPICLDERIDINVNASAGAPPDIPPAGAPPDIPVQAVDLSKVAIEKFASSRQLAQFMQTRLDAEERIIASRSTLQQLAISSEQKAVIYRCELQDIDHANVKKRKVEEAASASRRLLAEEAAHRRELEANEAAHRRELEEKALERKMLRFTALGMTNEAEQLKQRLMEA